MEKIKQREFRAPEFLNAPFLTQEYIQENGWYPVPDEWLSEPIGFVDSSFLGDEKGNIYKKTEFGNIQCKSRDEFKIDDIVILQDYKGYSENEKYFRIEQEHIQAYEDGRWNLLPDAVVVHQPEED